jgi:hypothetical protein
MRPVDVATLVILVVAVYFAWRIMKGSLGGVPLYGLVIAVPLCLLGVAFAALFENRPLVEVLTVAAVALSLAILPASPGLWEDELSADLRGTHVFQVIRAGDALSWRAWLKLVDRMGAGRAALVFLSVEAVAIGCALPALLTISAEVPPGFALVTLLAPSLLAALAAFWLYRAARRLVPGA